MWCMWRTWRVSWGGSDNRQTDLGRTCTGSGKRLTDLSSGSNYYAEKTTGLEDKMVILANL